MLCNNKNFFQKSLKLFHSSSILNEIPIKHKNVPVYSFINPNARTERTKERLYVWGYAGVGALGSLQFFYVICEFKMNYYIYDHCKHQPQNRRT